MKRLLLISYGFKHLSNYFGMENFTGMEWNNNSFGFFHVYPVTASGSDQFKTRFQ